MTDLQQWAREIEAGVTGYTWALLLNWDVAGQPAGTEEVVGFDAYQCAALIAHLREVAEGLDRQAVATLTAIVARGKYVGTVSDGDAVRRLEAARLVHVTHVCTFEPVDFGHAIARYLERQR